jgi:hypothetical protein
MSHPVLDSKDRRSYEHARQKHLHPSDRCTSRSNNYKYRVGNSKKDFLILRPSGVRWVDPMARDDLDVKSDLDYVGPYDGWDVDESPAAADIFPLEVSLTDLVRPPRKRKGIAKDYEFVPRVRPVMIIDDGVSDSGSDSDPSGSGDDDGEALDWEVVPELGKPRDPRTTPPKPPTYAAVVRTK